MYVITEIQWRRRNETLYCTCPVEVSEGSWVSLAILRALGARDPGSNPGEPIPFCERSGRFPSSVVDNSATVSASDVFSTVDSEGVVSNRSSGMVRVASW